MSIRLSIEDYCQYCPEFEPEKLVDYIMSDQDEESGHVKIIVKCRYSKRCKNMERHIRRILNKEREQ